MTGIVNLILWTHQQSLLLGKHLSAWQVKQVLKFGRFTWRRVRKSLKSQRDEGLFTFFKSEIEILIAESKKGHIRLWFYDESGFNLNPAAIYAWLPPYLQSENLYLPAKRGNILTVAGFLDTNNTLEAYAQKGAMDSFSFIAFVEDFIKNQVKNDPIKHIVIIDNASFHKSDRVKKKWRFGKNKIYTFSFYRLMPRN